MDVVLRAVDLSRPPANQAVKAKRERRHSQEFQTPSATSSLPSSSEVDSCTEEKTETNPRPFARLHRRQSDEPSSSGPLISTGSTSPRLKPTLVKRLGFTVGALSLGRSSAHDSIETGSSPLSAPALTSGKLVPGLTRKLSLRSTASRRDSNLSAEGPRSPAPTTPKFSHHSPASAKTPGSCSSRTTPTRTVGARLSSLLRGETTGLFGSEDGNSMRQGERSAQHELDIVLTSRENRNALVEQLLAAHQRTLSLSVRFISGINEVLRCETTRDIRFKAKKLVSIFLEPGSSYFIQNTEIGKDVVSAVHQGSIEGLTALKKILLCDLLTDDVVRSFLKEHTGLTTDPDY